MVPTVKMPPLHVGQREVRKSPARFKVLACGRRWGKTRLGAALCFATAIKGGAAWWVAPSYKVAAVGWRQLKGLAKQVPGTVLREVERKAEFPTGGWYQVRSADDPDSLRGEGLDRVVMDECAFITEAAWTEAIRPSLSDRQGSALFISTPKGQNWFWRLWERGREERDGFASWRFPSVTNPYLKAEEVEAARKELPERTYQQEYLAEFLEDGGGVFRGVNAAVDKGRTAPEPPQPGRTYFVGVDLARIEDFTVVCVMDSTGKQVYFERFNQINWERQVAAIARASARYGKAIAILDSTGQGDPVWEMVRKAGVPCRPYTFTHASKEAAIDNLAMGIEGGKVRLMDVPTQTTELQAYQYELTAARNVKMNAPAGMHDDCVIALALAAWGSTRIRKLEVC
jgi:hypothetical protein